MGWSGGSELIIQTWKLVRKRIPVKDHVPTLAKLINLFSEHDWDCIEELDIPEFPEARKALIKHDPDMKEYFQEQDAEEG